MKIMAEKLHAEIHDKGRKVFILFYDENNLPWAIGFYDNTIEATAAYFDYSDGKGVALNGEVHLLRKYVKE